MESPSKFGGLQGGHLDVSMVRPVGFGYTVTERIDYMEIWGLFGSS